MKEQSKRILIFVSAVVVLLLTAAAMSSSIKNQWTYWDDPAYVTRNNDISLSQERHLPNLLTEYYAGNYHPLTMLTLALDFKFSGFKPRSYHISNFNYHLICTLLVYVFFLMLSGRWEIGAIVSLLFGIHPMHVESVAWVSGRKDLVYTLFFMVGLIAYLMARRQEARKWIWLGVAMLMFLLSALAKSAAVIFPVVLLLLDWYQDRKIDRGVWIEKVPFFAVSIGFGVLAIISQDAASGPTADTSIYNLIDRFFLISYALMFYIIKTVVPYGLSAMHYYPQKSGVFLPFYYYLAPIFLAGVGYGLYKIQFKRKEFLFGAGLFLAGLILVLQFVPVGRAVAADRYSYFSYLGAFFIYAHLLMHVIESKEGILAKLKPVIVVVFGAVCIGYGIQTWLRCPVWTDSQTLFSDVVKKYPDNYHGHFTLGKAWHGIKESDKALACYNRAIELNPEHADSYKNRAAIYWSKEDIQSTYKDYAKLVKLTPEDGEIWNNMGTVKLILLQKDLACDDFFKARDLGYDRANMMLYKHCRERMGAPE